jgi:hypothetical protein
MGQMRMEHVGLIAVDPVMELDPAARVGESFAHVQAEEYDVF